MNVLRNHLVGRKFGGRLFIAALPLLLLGCVSPIEPAGPVVWNGSLQPIGTAPLPISGSVAMLAHPQSTQVGIGIEGSEEGLTFRWELRRGTCAAVGEPVADPSVFPVIELGPQGSGESELVLNGRVDTSGSYLILVRRATGSQAEVACGRLDRQN